MAYENHWFPLTPPYKTLIFPRETYVIRGAELVEQSWGFQGHKSHGD